MNFSRGRLIEFGIIALWGLCPLLWFIPGHLIVGVDLHVPVDLERWGRQIWAWNELWGTGFEWSVGFSNLVFSGVSALSSFFIHDLRALEQTFFVFWFLAPGIACYRLAHELKPEPERWDFRLSMTNFYMFNLYLQALWGGNEAGLSAYAGLPLVLAFYLRALKTRQYLRYAFVIGLAGLILSASSMNLPLMVVALA
ncbi:MAG: hypothetical protein HY594_03600, partial [Candidatus Omnitrophica bacterium]|nr:hypothetical protein [Candidatus Omnitrophota bacterium]